MAQKYKVLERIDPYVAWALGPGRGAYFTSGREVMPLLLRVSKDRAQEFVAGTFIASRTGCKVWQKSLEILGRHVDPGMAANSAVWIGAMLTEQASEILSTAGALRGVQSASLGPPLSLAALKTMKALRIPRRRSRSRAARSVGAGAAPPAVIMGIIDDGIAFAHRRFQLATTPPTTRVEYCWVQGPPIDRFYTKLQIDNLLAASGGDEELLYRLPGGTPPGPFYDFLIPDHHKSAALRVAHGTHVMDLACGREPIDMVVDRPIICVQLPPTVTANMIPGTVIAPGTLYYHIARAIRYIINRAQLISASWGSALPVVINISYGLLADCHDGTGGLEAFIEDMILECQNVHGFDLRVVMPAGNSYLSRTHALISFTAPNQVRRLHWRVQPDDRSPSFLEVWLPSPIPSPATSRVTLTVTPPGGAPSMTTYEWGPSGQLNTPSGIYARARWNQWAPSDRTRFTVMVQPTAQPDLPVAQLAPAGKWEIELRNTGGLTAAPQDLVHAWIRRDDNIYGYPLRGRQSYLDDPDYERFHQSNPIGPDEEVDVGASVVKRESTINSMATGPSTIVIGGYIGKVRKAAKYSTAGARTGMPPPVPPTIPRRPDVMAVSDDARFHTGVLAAGSHSGSVVAMGGTSVAAPQVARLVADDLAGGSLGDRAAVQAMALVPILPPQLGDPAQPERTGAGGIVTAPIVRLRRYDP